MCSMYVIKCTFFTADNLDETIFRHYRVGDRAYSVVAGFIAGDVSHMEV